uniref:Uncharacterized protein n=1 Tax=Aegilops tauschii subsp. strangulata TaxID=200361 RepID=A0A452ZF72_AEGTS
MRRCFLASSFRRQMHARHCHGGSDPDAPSWFLVASPPGCCVTTLRCGAACRRRSRRPTPSWGSPAWTSSSTRFGCSGPGPSSTPSWGSPSCSLLDLLFYPPFFCCRSALLRLNSRRNLSLG